MVVINVEMTLRKIDAGRYLYPPLNGAVSEFLYTRGKDFTDSPPR